MEQPSAPFLCVSRHALRFALALGGLTCSLRGQDVVATGGQTGAENWSLATWAAGQWDDGLAPSAGKTYSSGAFDIRTTDPGGSVFGGDSLRLPTGGRLVLKQAYGSTVTVNLILDGGTLFSGVSTTGGTLQQVSGTVSVNANSILDLSDGSRRRVQHVSGSFGGSGNLLLQGKNIDDVYLINAAVTSSHTGNWTIDGGRLAVSQDTHIGDLAAVNLVNTSSFLDLRSNQRIGSLQGAGTVNAGVAGSFTLFTGGNDASTSHSGVIANGSGTIGLTKEGTGTFTVTGNHTFSGATAISAGTLVIGGGSTWGGGTYAGAVSVASGATLQHASSANQTFSGPLSGAGELRKTGSGILTLSNGSNSHSGTIVITGGTVRPGNAVGLGAIGKPVNVSGGGTLDFNGFNDTSRNYEFTISGAGVGGAGAVINSGGGGNFGPRYLILAGDATIGGSGRWDVRPSTGSGDVDLGGFTLTKTGSNKIGFVDSTMTAAGTIVVNQGQLALTRMTVSGAGDIEVNAGGTLQLENYTSGSFNKAISLQGGQLQMFGTPTRSSPNALTVGGAGGTVDVAATNHLTFSGDFSGSGTLTKANAGTLTLSGAGSFTGPINLQAGVLVSGSNTILTGGTAAIALGNSTTLRHTPAGTTAASRGLTLAGIIGSTVDVTNAGGELSLSGPISGGLATLTKDGAGTFNLTGAGQLNVLLVNAGSYLQSGGVSTINSSATGIQVAAGATYSLNGGTLRTDRVDLTGSGAFEWGNATLTLRQLNANGSNGVTDRSDPAGAPSGPAVYEGTILNFTGDLATTAGSRLDLGGLYFSNGYRYDQLSVSGDLDLTSGGNSVHFAINPYFLRPSSPSSVFSGDWGSLILVDAASLAGTFDQFDGIGNDQIGWRLFTPGQNGDPLFTTAGDLPLNSYFIEYGAEGVFFHYRVAGAVPEPETALLLLAGLGFLRARRWLREVRRATGDGGFA
jgi:autotransporter-associated beta strand protein